MYPSTYIDAAGNIVRQSSPRKFIVKQQDRARLLVNGSRRAGNNLSGSMIDKDSMGLSNGFGSPLRSPASPHKHASLTNGSRNASPIAPASKERRVNGSAQKDSRDGKGSANDLEFEGGASRM